MILKKYEPYELHQMNRNIKKKKRTQLPRDIGKREEKPKSNY